VKCKYQNLVSKTYVSFYVDLSKLLLEDIQCIPSLEKVEVAIPHIAIPQYCCFSLAL